MLLYAVAFLGGILTIVSPCVLPVVPFLFTRADQPFRRTGLAMVAGGRLFNFMKRSLGVEAWMKRALGVTVLAGLSVIAMGWDASLLARVKLVDTAVAEQRLVDRLGPPTAAGKSLEQFAAEEASLRLQDEGAMPEFAGATAWLGSRPLTPASLRGKVVLVDFWTFGCYNCLNALPYVKALHAKYKDHVLVVIGVHTPEFAHERDRKNVERAIRRLGVEYPVVMDNDYRIWRAYHTRYWPAAYYVDQTGRIRYHHFGEGRYAEQEQVVRKLLAEAALAALPSPSTPHARSEQ